MVPFSAGHVMGQLCLCHVNGAQSGKKGQRGLSRLRPSFNAPVRPFTPVPCMSLLDEPKDSFNGISLRHGPRGFHLRLSHPAQRVVTHDQRLRHVPKNGAWGTFEEPVGPFWRLDKVSGWMVELSRCQS